MKRLVIWTLYPLSVLCLGVLFMVLCVIAGLEWLRGVHNGWRVR